MQRVALVWGGALRQLESRGLPVNAETLATLPEHIPCRRGALVVSLTTQLPLSLHSLGGTALSSPVVT